MDFPSTSSRRLIKNGVNDRFDIEGALSYIFEKMMMPTSNTGEPRNTLFGGFDEKQPYTSGFNPLQARFMSFLKFAINNIKRGKIVRLSNVERQSAGLDQHRRWQEQGRPLWHHLTRPDRRSTLRRDRLR